MKKFKKTLAVLLSLTALSAVNPLGSQAIYCEIYKDDPSFPKLTENYTQIEYTDLFNYKGYYSPKELYVRNNGTDSSDVSFIGMVSMPDVMSIKVTENSTFQDLTNTLELYNTQNGTDFLSDFELVKIWGTDCNYSILPLYSTETVSIKDVKGISELLKSHNLISEFKLKCNRVTIQEGRSNTGEFYDADYNTVKVYVEENYPDFDVTYEKSSFSDENIVKVTPETDMPCIERVKVSEQISKALDIHPILEIAETLFPQFSTDIDVFNSVDGDVNCDNSANIADSVLILQSIANPDSYQLSEQGKFNADIVNIGDGVTALDALELQKIESQ